MSQSRERAAQKTNTQERAPEQPATPELGEQRPPENGNMAHPGVVVMRVPIEGQAGTEEVKIMPINGLDPLAIPTLLRKAASIHEQQLGI